jgi:hypothetical protein
MNNYQFIPTAYSRSGSCFICGERVSNRPLRKVNQQDIIHAYKNHRILIKSLTRVCDAHYDDNGLIRKEEFFILRTKERPQNKDIIKMLDVLSQKNPGVFDAFKEINFLDDEYCKKITGWTKEEFCRFASYIVSILNSKNRTKEQLIALYRYWLRTGIDQTSLASLFGEKTRQQDISDYLDQIRVAINKDFVSHYLGSNKKREFFLKFNTIMTQRIHNLEEDNLVFIADGTYNRIEKSSNNDFQYRTYSQQKCDSLMKPFIICCADGYIVDCYGPFAANANDATIMNYILNNDVEFRNLCIPEKTTFILDRGKCIASLELIYK